MSDTPYTPWLGQCHYQQAEIHSETLSSTENPVDKTLLAGDKNDPHTETTILKEYQALAAVWANDHITYSNTLNQRLNAQGKTLLWAEQALPIDQWLEQHGTNETAISLAKAVNQGHKLQLGSAIVLDADGSSDDDQDYLIIEEIEGVEPLDEQFGVYPKKTVPDKLYQTLFGQLEPAAEEIDAAGGDPDKVPPMKFFAILDAAKITNLSELLESSKLDYECLFKGEAYEELKTVAPYIVELKEHNDFTRHLFTQPKQDDGQPITDPNHTDDIPWFLWNKEPGIYIRSRGTLQKLQHHFRKFTKVQDETGKWFYLRFGDSGTAQYYFESIKHVAKKTSQWFSLSAKSLNRIECIIGYSLNKSKPVWKTTPNWHKLSEPVSTGAIILSDREIQALSAYTNETFITELNDLLTLRHPELYTWNSKDAGIEAARQYQYQGNQFHLTTKGQLRAWSDMLICLGHAFYDDPIYHFSCQNNPDLYTPERISKIFSIYENFSAKSGYLLLKNKIVAAILIPETVGAYCGKTAPSAQHAMQNIYAEKYQAINQANIPMFCNCCMTDYAGQGWSDKDAASSLAFILLSFIFGRHFYTNPYLPGVEKNENFDFESWILKLRRI